jgi:peptidoglycan/LPS O-acetylase OafA/YrhL
MIQRIQTIYLFLAAVFMALLFALPFLTAEATTEGPLQDGDYDVMDNIALLILVIAIVLLNIGTIFLFKNRKLQMNLSRIGLVAIIALLGLVALFIFGTAEKLGVGLGMFTPPIALILLFLANRAIYKDEKLVRDSDRLR